MGRVSFFVFFTFLHFLVDRKRVSANQLYILNLQDVPDTIMEKNGFATFWLRRNCKLKIAFAWQNLVFHFFLAKSKKVKISFSVILCSSKNAIQWYFYNKNRQINQRGISAEFRQPFLARPACSS